MTIFLVVMAGVVVLVGALVAGGFAILRREYGDRTEILRVSSAVAPKRALVVYQPSITPASSDVAHAIADGLHDAGFEVTLSNPGRHPSPDVSGYSVVVCGSPNYGGSVAEALTAWVRQVEDFSGKVVVLYATSGAVEIMPELDSLAELIHGAEPVARVKFPFRETEKNRTTARQLGLDAGGW